MSQQTYDIFISYRQSYIPWVESLYINLCEQGFSVFLDTHSLIQGRPLEEDIYSYIDQVKHFIVIATNDILSKDSLWVPKECRYAEDLQQSGKLLSIHTITFDTSQPPSPFKKVHLYLDASRNDVNSYRWFFQKLCESFNDRKAREAYEGWLDIPEKSIDDMKVLGTSNVPKQIVEKGQLAMCISELKQQTNLEYLKAPHAKSLHQRLTELYKSKNKQVKQQALLVLCLLHHGYSPFDQKRVKLEGLDVDKITKLVGKMGAVSANVIGRLRNIPSTSDKKMICMMGV